mmetsp:Transcript_20762/g.64571  ORF Transcript_20762/g.64571 Transcript_20762/m.64571 type:complete len:209 (+) Transcript_20762:147-773(+)
MLRARSADIPARVAMARRSSALRCMYSARRSPSMSVFPCSPVAAVMLPCRHATGCSPQGCGTSVARRDASQRQARTAFSEMGATTPISPSAVTYTSPDVSRSPSRPFAGCRSGIAERTVPLSLKWPSARSGRLSTSVPFGATRGSTVNTWTLSRESNVTSPATLLWPKTAPTARLSLVVGSCAIISTASCARTYRAKHTERCRSPMTM